jgi:hypothetical protein
MNMGPKLLLRIASLLALIQFAAHTSLLLTYAPKHGPEEAAVVEAMKSHAFNFGGVRPHSYWEMYFGYGLFAAVNCLIEAILFWQLTSGSVNLAPARSIVLLFCLANIGYAILVWKYFFLVPLVFDAAIALCLAAAYVLLM